MQRRENKVNGFDLEICANSIASAKAAERGGATRIELCQSLELGGTTPSWGLLKNVLHETELGVYVLIRPRTGDFVYNEEEVKEMVDDIQQCKDLGASGVVIGALTREGDVDTAVMEELIKAAKGMKLVFHRAIDSCRDPELNIRKIIDLGFDRILTSGQQSSAYKGRKILKEWVSEFGGEIEVMPGAGIDEGNLEEIIRTTGVHSVHSSAKTIYPSKMTYENPAFSEMNEPEIQSDEEKVRKLVDILKKL